MPGLIGKKLGMTSIYSASGKNIPCTILEVGPCVVTQVRTLEKDGYSAVQLGYGERSEKRTSKAMQGHFKRAGVSLMRKLVEFKGFNDDVKAGKGAKVTNIDARSNAVRDTSKDTGNEREARLETALRANLRKRKQQARARSEQKW